MNQNKTKTRAQNGDHSSILSSSKSSFETRLGSDRYDQVLRSRQNWPNTPNLNEYEGQIPDNTSEVNDGSLSLDKLPRSQILERYHLGRRAERGGKPLF